MTNSNDVEKLLKQYTEGHISKQEFLHLHALITQTEQPLPAITPENYLPPIAPAEMDEKPHSGFRFAKHYLKSIVAFMGSLSILSTLAINYYHNYASSPTHESETVKTTQERKLSSKTNQPAKPATKDINSLAVNLLDEAIWDARGVNRFTTRWVALTKTEREVAKTDQWYRQIIDALRKQVKFELARQNVAGNTDDTENRRRALMHMALTLNIVPANYHPKSLGELDRKLSSLAPRRPSVSAKKSVSAPEADRTQSGDVNAVDSADSDIAKQINEIIQPQDIAKIPESDLANVMNQYLAAYRSGNHRQLVSLFANDKTLHRPLTLSSVKAQYDTLFQNTAERSAEFSGITWEQHDSEAIGKGEFRSSFRLLPGGKPKTVTSKVMLAMRKVDNVTRITDFELNDNSLFSSLPGNASQINSLPPTSAELQGIITQYAQSYQSGDIKRLMQLFAGGNWTAGPAGLRELRQKYSNLFQATSSRQVSITNMDWSFKGNKAMGTGDLVINLISKANHKTTTKKGKLRMVVEKNRKSLISRLFQVVN